jgi:hypothetical protein
MEKRIYELTPTNGRKSFYGKALVYYYSDYSQTLVSYHTEVIHRGKDGKLYRMCDPSLFSLTTSTHIKSFCGLNKAEASKLPLWKA